MAEPFQRDEAGAGPPRDDASLARALEDALARPARIRDVAPAVVGRLARAAGVDLRRELQGERHRLYRLFLEHCLRDGHVSREESDDLAHLRGLLHLGEADARAIHDAVAVAVYGRAVDEVLADHRLDPDEEQFLARLRDELALTKEEADVLLREGEDRARRRLQEP